MTNLNANTSDKMQLAILFTGMRKIARLGCRQTESYYFIGI